MHTVNSDSDRTAEAPSKATPKAPHAPKRKRAAPKVVTQFRYPVGANCSDLRYSRRGIKLTEAMRDYVRPRLLPKLEARSKDSLDCIRHDGLSVEFRDACVYLNSWLGYGDICGVTEFPFARLYPVQRGFLYNLSIRRLIDWTRAEDEPVMANFNTFFFQAPNARFWVKVARNKTFEECIDLLVKDPNF